MTAACALSSGVGGDDWPAGSYRLAGSGSPGCDGLLCASCGEPSVGGRDSGIHLILERAIPGVLELPSFGRGWQCFPATILALPIKGPVLDLDIPALSGGPLQGL